MRFIGIIGLILLSFTCYGQSDSTIKWHCDSVEFIGRKMITSADIYLQHDRIVMFVGSKPTFYNYSHSYRFDNEYIISVLTKDSEAWQFQLKVGVIKYESIKFYKCLILK